MMGSGSGVHGCQVLLLTFMCLHSSIGSERDVLALGYTAALEVQLTGPYACFHICLKLVWFIYIIIGKP